MTNQYKRAREWLHSVAGRHLPKTARTYKLAVYTGEANINSALGMQFDLHPAEGTVVEVTEEWVLLKIGRAAEFFVAARALLDSVPELQASVRITPYARRGFDGQRLDAPKREHASNGVCIETYTLGETRSRLPLQHDELRCPELRDLVEQIEQLPSPDGVRRLAQVLVDAGAGSMPIALVDPEPEEIIDTPPSLRFRVATAKVDGWIEYRYDRGLDAYDMVLTDAAGQTIREARTVFFDQIAGTTVDWIDDGTWRIARVEILRPAPRKARAA